MRLFLLIIDSALHAVLAEACGWLKWTKIYFPKHLSYDRELGPMAMDLQRSYYLTDRNQQNKDSEVVALFLSVLKIGISKHPNEFPI